MKDDVFKSTAKILKTHAKGLGIPSGAADDFIVRALSSAQKSLQNKSIITDADLIRAVTKELKKYNPDLAYVYGNYAIII